MPGKFLTTFDEVVLGLGGVRGVMDFTGRGASSVSDWKSRGFFPAILADAMREELWRRGRYRVAGELFRMEKRNTDKREAAA